MNILWKFIKKHMNTIFFRPGVVGLVLNPFYLVRSGLYYWIKKNTQYMTWTMIDFWCWAKPWKDLFTVDKYIGVDIKVSWHDHQTSQVDVFYDGKSIPFEDNSIDSIFSSETLEHIFNLEDIVRECHRILKPWWYMLITVPFAWPEHEKPYDFWRYTSYGLKHLFTEKWFEIVRIKPTNPFITTIFQLISAYVVELINTKFELKNIWLMILQWIISILITFPINLIGLILGWILPRKYELTNSFVMVVKKK